ncbi:DUF1279 super [Coemansia sp. RSA 986]|nr:DUF1279 super [Coemansia sp. RSA 986]
MRRSVVFQPGMQKTLSLLSAGSLLRPAIGSQTKLPVRSVAAAYSSRAYETSSKALSLLSHNSGKTVATKMSQHYSVSVLDTASTSRPSTPVSATSTVSSIGSTMGVRNISSSSNSSSSGGRKSDDDLERGVETSEGENPAEGGKKKEEKKPGRFKVLMQQYGRIAVVMYLLVSMVDLSICVWGVWLGGDSLVYTINSYLGQYIPRLQKAAQRMEEGQGGGADRWATIFIVGYAVHKCLTPLRLAITAAVLPWSARTAQKWGLTWLIPKSAPTVKHHKPFSTAADAIRRKLK